MTWWYYLIIYYVICIIILTCCALYDIKKNAKKGSWGAKEWIRLFVFGPFVLPIVAFMFGFSGIVGKIKERRQKVIFIKKYGFSPDEHYERFTMMGGAGVIVCEECGHKEKIISFVHGLYHCAIGRQCPICYAFVVEPNESDKASTFGESKEDFVCSNCGALIRKIDESILKGHDDPLYCPKCHSHKLHYHCEYMT